MIPSIDNFLKISWNDVCLSNKAQCVLRHGKYICIFDEYYTAEVPYRSNINISPIDYKYRGRYPQERTLKIHNLETNCLEIEFPLHKDEKVCAFSYPYVLTLVNGDLKLFDLSKEILEPFSIMHGLHFATICKADIVENVLAVCLISNERKQVACFSGINDLKLCKTTSFDDLEIDYETGFKIWNGYVIYSIGFGSLKIVKIDDPQSVRCVTHVDDLNAYLEELTEERFKEYKETIVTSLVAEKNIVAGATKINLKIWDIASGILIKTIPGEDMNLLSLDGRFLLGTNKKMVKIWDILSGFILYEEKRKYLGNNIPHLTLYKDSIYRVQEQWGVIEKRGEIIVWLPPEQPKPTEEPDYFDIEDSEICVVM